jgi:hypothetical protein
MPASRARPRPDIAEELDADSLNELRRKIRQNRVSFPSQVPTFLKHDRPDLQRKAVQLYFLFGWSCSRIARRLGILRQRVQQILSTWKRRAIQLGYIQEIPAVMPPPKLETVAQ